MNLNPMFKPKSIAIIGASKGNQKIGARPIYQLKSHNYQGDVYPVNPKYEEIEGFLCYKNIESLPDEIDLAIIAISSDKVLSSLEQLSMKSIKSAIVFSSGFSEANEEGKQYQRELIDFVEKTGIPVCGPNTNGLFNFELGVFATFAFLDYKMSSPIGFITQSGAYGSAIYRMLNEFGIGYNYFAATGNEASIDFFDYAQYMMKQEEVKVIGGYLEGITNIEQMKCAVELSQKFDKPIVLNKVGNSKKGSEAAESHTASLAGDSAVYNSFFKQNNIISVETEEELVDTLNIFTKANKNMYNDKICIVTISGGAGIIMADKAEEFGLPLSNLSPETESKLKEVLPSFASLSNPIDVTAQITQNQEVLFDAFDLILKDDDVGIVIFYIQISDQISSEYIYKLEKQARETNKIFIIVWTGASNETKEKLNSTEICWIPSPSRAMRAIKNIVNYNVKKEELSKRNKKVINRFTEPVYLEPNKEMVNEFIAKQYLFDYGISIPTGKIVENIDDAKKFIEKINYPVVLKASSSHIAHKSDIGVVKTNIESDIELELSYKEIMKSLKRHNLDKSIDGILLEQMIEDGIEVFVGITKDPVLGSFIMVGLGGIFIEVINDFAIKMLPLEREEAYEMVKSIKGYKILKGVRGKGPYDIDKLIETILKISEFYADQEKWISEIDINPVIVHQEGKGVTALDALIIPK